MNKELNDWASKKEKDFDKTINKMVATRKGEVLYMIVAATIITALVTFLLWMFCKIF